MAHTGIPSIGIFESWLNAESRSTHHEIRNSGGKYQKSDQPTNKSLLRRGKHMINLFLRAGSEAI
jgi:hypothetical protein